MIRLKRKNGSNLTLDPELAAGGEGKIYKVIEERNSVAKVYYKPKPEHTAKLHSMLSDPPHDPTREKWGHYSIAWPTEGLFDAQKRCLGFLMPYIERTSSVLLLKVYNPQHRRKTVPGFTWEYLLRTAKHLAGVVAALHEKGYVVGDLNESNILVTRTALVTLVDCDSIQVPQGNTWIFRFLRQLPLPRWPWLPWNKVFRCPVGKPEYTPPELQGCNFSEVDRTPDHDNFGLAVLIFLLLMEGRHPFASVWQGAGTPPLLEQHIQVGRFPYTSPGRTDPSSLVSLPKLALPFDTLPPSLQKLMERCFRQENRTAFALLPLVFTLLFLSGLVLGVVGVVLGAVTHSLQTGLLLFTPGVIAVFFSILLDRQQRQRPTAKHWYEALKDVEQNLAFCSVNSQHIYSKHLGNNCPWCRRKTLIMDDPFPPTRTPAVRQLPSRSLRQKKRPAYLTGGVFLLTTLATWGIESLIWRLNEPRIGQWFSHISFPLNSLLLAPLLIIPIVISFVVYHLIFGKRLSRR